MSPNYSVSITEFKDGKNDVCKLFIEAAEGFISFADVLKLWQGNEEFRRFFSDTLASMPFSAFRWETPALSNSTMGRKFECVILDAPNLDRPMDTETFREELSRQPGDFAALENIGGDALLVIPTNRSDACNYTHLASFLRTAPESQRNEIWRHVGEALQGRLSERPLWLSTAGAGVAWLHVRMDSRPKYYAYAPYRSPCGQ